MEKDLPSELTLNYFLTAGETDAQGRMPLWLIFSRLIEAATLHANALGVGYAALSPLRMGWVLTRVSIEVVRYLSINESYDVTTWIEGYNRLYSDRCFLFTDAEGKPVAHIRSMWVAIDMDKRRATDLSRLDREHFVVSERRCPVGRIGKQPPIGDDAAAMARDYTWQFCDIDFNRHVNTVQYVRHILNQWDMERYDKNEIGRFDISFHNECHYGDTARLRHVDLPEERSLCEIIDPQGRHAVTASVVWRKLTGESSQSSPVAGITKSDISQ